MYVSLMQFIDAQKFDIRNKATSVFLGPEKHALSSDCLHVPPALVTARSPDQTLVAPVPSCRMLPCAGSADGALNLALAVAASSVPSYI